MGSTHILSPALYPPKGYPPPTQFSAHNCGSTVGGKGFTFISKAFTLRSHRVRTHYSLTSL